MQKTIDRPLLLILVILVLAGFFVFCSASLGLLAREGARLSAVAFNQILFGIVGGTVALIITTNIQYRFWRKYAFYIMGASLLMTALVFSPLGMEHGGARRWLAVGSFSFQPTEFLKFAFIIYMATWLSGMQKFITTFKKGILPFGGIIAVVGALMLAQPDTDTFAVMALSAIAMFVTAGGRWRDMFIAGAIGLVMFAGLVFERPYLMDRIKTFVDPSADQQGKSWQVKQSLIAIGSGGFAGRGFGQSIQSLNTFPSLPATLFLRCLEKNLVLSERQSLLFCTHSFYFEVSKLLPTLRIFLGCCSLWVLVWSLCSKLSSTSLRCLHCFRSLAYHFRLSAMAVPHSLRRLQASVSCSMFLATENALL